MADNENSSGGSGRSAGVKVELDIEDAPFLEEEEPQRQQSFPSEPPEERVKPQPAKTAEVSSGFADKIAAFLSNKKRLAFIGGGLAFLLIAPLVLMFLMGGKDTTPPTTGPERVTASATPPREDAPDGPKFLYKTDNFLVPLRGSEGELRFLHCGFAVPTDNPQLFAELMAKNIAVRDAIYYYLSNKPLRFLSDQQARPALKQDLISVINEHASAEKISELFFDDYLITAK